MGTYKLDPFIKNKVIKVMIFKPNKTHTNFLSRLFVIKSKNKIIAHTQPKADKEVTVEIVATERPLSLSHKDW